jgi:hypothetical protein
MVQVCSTVVKHSRWVMRPSSRIHAHSNRSSFQCSLNSSTAWSFCDCIDMEVSSLLDACPIDSLVRISCLSCDSVVFNVSQSELSWAAIAAVSSVGFGAVDQLLFRKICCFFL